jgi:hypothetical protein
MIQNNKIKILNIILIYFCSSNLKWLGQFKIKNKKKKQKSFVITID